MIVNIILTTAGVNTGPFNLYSDVDGFVSAFETGIDKDDLTSGYISNFVPPNTSIIKVKSNGACLSFTNITVNRTTTTTTTVALNCGLSGIAQEI